MNGSGNGKTESNKTIITIVVGALAINLTIAVVALGYCLVTNTKPDATLLTAFVGIAGTLGGYMGGTLNRTTPTHSTPVEQSKPAGKIEVPAQELETTSI